MDSSSNVVIVLYDFAYSSKDKRKIEVNKGEKLYLIDKTNADWWQVIRSSERRSFFVPAQYVEEVQKPQPARHDDTAEYENLNALLDQADDLPSLPSEAAPSVAKAKVAAEEIRKQKPVPKTRTKVTTVGRNNYENAGIAKSESTKSITMLIRDSSDKKVDRARSSERSRQEVGLSLPKNSDSLTNIHAAPHSVENVVYSNLQQLSGHRSRPTGRQTEIRGKPGDIGKNRMRNSYNLKVKPSKSFDYHHSNALKLERKQSVPLPKVEQQTSNAPTLSRSLEKLAEEIKFEPKKMAEKSVAEKRGKTDDVSRILDEERTTPHKPSMLGYMMKSFRSKGARKIVKKEKGPCVRSSSWEGGLDKIEEREAKPLVVPTGLQRSKTFMVVERSPFAARNTRVNIAYHSRRPTDKIILTTFKPNPSTNVKKTEVYANIPISHPIEMQLAAESEEHLEEKTIAKEEPSRDDDAHTMAALGSIAENGSRTAPRVVSQNSVDSKTSDSEDGSHPKKRPSIMRHNRVTSKPESPRTPSPTAKATKRMKDGWAEYTSGPRTYYYNSETGHKSWKPPRSISSQDKEQPLHTSKESVASDASRSNTSSPLNDPHTSHASSPSLTRSTVSLNSSPSVPSAGTKTPTPWSQSPSSNSLNATKSSRESLDLEEEGLGGISVRERRDLLLQTAADDYSRRHGPSRTFNTWQSSTEDTVKENQEGHNTSDGSGNIDQSYGIQRSSTESAICKQPPAKLRPANADRIRVPASSRASKAQSMVLDNRNEHDQFKTNSMGRPNSSMVVKSGLLFRTKTLDNGKKLRKNWTRAFVVLNYSQIAFYKDEKAFKNSKTGRNTANPHLDCLDLGDAEIDRGDKLSKRKNVYRIAAGNSEVLIQADSTTDSDEWYSRICDVIDQLASKNGVVRPASRVRSRDPDILESPTSETPPEAGSKTTRGKLKWFLSRRPTKEVLMKKGIYKDEQVFGRSLEDLTKNRSSPRIPEFVRKCIEVIESDEKNLESDGLYRASGNLSQVQKIRLEVDQDRLQCLEEEKEVHVLTGSLKLFFRELKESLIPYKAFNQLKDKLHNDNKRIEPYKEMVKNLPPSNRDTLRFLLAHLKQVEKRSSSNRMDINNLAIVFGPTLIWSDDKTQQDMAFGLMEQNTVVAFLLERYDEIFN